MESVLFHTNNVLYFSCRENIFGESAFSKLRFMSEFGRISAYLNRISDSAGLRIRPVFGQISDSAGFQPDFGFGRISGSAGFRLDGLLRASMGLFARHGTLGGTRGGQPE